MTDHPINRRTMISSGAAALALGAAPTARAQGMTLSFAALGGSPRNSPDANRRWFASAMDRLGRQGGGTLRVEPGTYPFTGNVPIAGRNVTVLPPEPCSRARTAACRSWKVPAASASSA